MGAVALCTSSTNDVSTALAGWAGDLPLAQDRTPVPFAVPADCRDLGVQRIRGEVGRSNDRAEGLADAAHHVVHRIERPTEVRDALDQHPLPLALCREPCPLEGGAEQVGDRAIVGDVVGEEEAPPGEDESERAERLIAGRDLYLDPAIVGETLPMWLEARIGAGAFVEGDRGPGVRLPKGRPVRRQAVRLATPFDKALNATRLEA